MSRIPTAHLENLRARGAATTLVLHDECPDGIAAARVLGDVFPQATRLFLQYDTPEHLNLRAKPGMLFCDFTPHRSRVHDFVKEGAVVLDHHASARDVVAAFGERGIFAHERTEPGVSGASMALRDVWMPMHGIGTVTTHSILEGLMMRMVQLAAIRDTWQTKDPRWEAACAQGAALLFWPRQRVLQADWRALDDLLRIGADLRANHLKTVRETVRSAAKVRVGDTRAIVFQGNRDITSDAAEMVDSDLVAGFNYTVENGRQHLSFSVRSRGWFRCDLFARYHQGGGHRHAAGFRVASEGAMAGPYTILSSALQLYQEEVERCRRCTAGLVPCRAIECLSCASYHEDQCPDAKACPHCVGRGCA